MINKEVESKVTEVYDIVNEDGARVISCKKEGSTIMIQGKSASIPLSQFVAQATNPILARQMKSRRTKKNSGRSRESINI